MSPIFNVPDFRAPPSIPPCSLSISVPGLFISKLLAIRKIGVSSLFGFEISILQSSSRIMFKFIPWIADTGIIGEFSAIVPFMKFLIIL